MTAQPNQLPVPQCHISLHLPNYLLLFCLILLLPSFSCSTCSASSSSVPITTNQASYSGYSDAQNYGLIVGQISNSFYYMFYISGPTNVAIRKLNSDESAAWGTAIDKKPIMQSFAVDTNEQYVYFGVFGNPLIVIRLQASTGTVIEAKSL